MTKSVVTLISAVLLLVGLLGFFNDPVLGIFEVNTVHNLIHLLSGAVGLAMAAQGMAATFAKAFGAIYGLVTILGFMTHTSDAPGMLLGLVEINHADNYLHLLLTVVLLAVGFMKPAATTPAAARR
jgi:hypothetical protein